MINVRTSASDQGENTEFKLGFTGSPKPALFCLLLLQEHYNVLNVILPRQLLPSVTEAL